jgi:hypothetical protein
VGYVLISDGTVDATWQSDTTPLTGAFHLTLSGVPLVLPFSPIGWFETASGKALNLNMSDDVSVTGHLAYVEVPVAPA